MVISIKDINLRGEKEDGSHYGNIVHYIHSHNINEYTTANRILEDLNLDESIYVSTGRGIVAEWSENEQDNKDFFLHNDYNKAIDVPEKNILLIDWNGSMCEEVKKEIEKHPEKFKDKNILIARADFSNEDQMKELVEKTKEEFGENAKVTRMDLTNIPVPEEIPTEEKALDITEDLYKTIGSIAKIKSKKIEDVTVDELLSKLLGKKYYKSSDSITVNSILKGITNPEILIDNLNILECIGKLESIYGAKTSFNPKQVKFLGLYENRAQDRTDNANRWSSGLTALGKLFKSNTIVFDSRQLESGKSKTLSNGDTEPDCTRAQEFGKMMQSYYGNKSFLSHDQKKELASVPSTRFQESSAKKSCFTWLPKISLFSKFMS